MTRLRTLVSITIGAVIILWLANLFLTPFLLQLMPEHSRPQLGLLGDSFGAVNALFSGFGAFGIIIVLVMDRESRRVSTPPFLSFESESAQVWNASIDPIKQFELILRLKVSNHTSIVALNPHLQAKAQLRMESRVVLPNSPLHGGSNSAGTVTLSARDDDAISVMTELVNQGQAVVTVLVDYQGLNSTSWTTQAKLKLTLQGHSLARLRSVIEGGGGAAVVNGVNTGGESISLHIEEHPGSWEHSEKR